jgi:hypothetical protein
MRMVSWIETVGFIASDPGKVAVIITLAQSDRPLEELAIAQTAGMLHQRITGQPVETAVLLKHTRDLSERGLIERDESGFRWRMTPLGTLVSRQWATGALEPPGAAPLATDEVRGWRDRLVAQMEEDAALGEQAGIAPEELLPGQGPRLAELRVLNRVLGEERLPAWLRALAEQEQES